MQPKITYSPTTKYISNMATKQPTYNWDTQFNTANNTMTHTFSKHVQAVANIKKGEVLVKVDGNTVNAYYGMPVKEYEALLLGVEQYAYKLERKDRLKMLLAKVAVYIIVSVAILAFMALASENDSLPIGWFAAQKAACFAVMGGCYYSIKRTPVLAAAWRDIDNDTKA